MIDSANPTKAREKLGWRAEHSLEDLVREMVAADLERLGEPSAWRPRHD